MNEFLLQIRRIVDLLALVDWKLTVKEHISAIFDGLSREYETFVLSIETRKESYTVEEIEALLLSQEARYEKKNETHMLMDNNVAHLT